MIAYIANALYLVGYLCVIDILCHISDLMVGLNSSRTSSTLVDSPTSRVFTLGSLGVLGLYDAGSAGLAMVALLKTSESYLSAVVVLSLKGAYGMSVCGCSNASVSSKAAHVAVSADDKLGS